MLLLQLYQTVTQAAASATSSRNTNTLTVMMLAELAVLEQWDHSTAVLLIYVFVFTLVACGNWYLDSQLLHHTTVMRNETTGQHCNHLCSSKTLCCNVQNPLRGKIHFFVVYCSLL